MIPVGVNYAWNTSSTGKLLPVVASLVSENEFEHATSKRDVWQRVN